MARVAGVIREKTYTGRSRYVRIDLNKHGKNETLNSFFREVGFESEEPIKWTAKMKRSFAEAKNGEWKKGDINNFWDV